MKRADDIGVDAVTFQRVYSVYRKRWEIDLCAARPDGSIVFARRGPHRHEGLEQQQVCRLAIEESLRWGEAEIQSGPRSTLIWAVPLLYNSKLLGGLVAEVAERRVFPQGQSVPVMDVRAAGIDLRRLAEEYNLTNASLLESRRGASQRERERAEAIHAFKAEAQYDMRAAYLLDEPMLLAAIRKGDRGQARLILNRLLVGMIHRAGESLDLVKSFFMELVAMLCRTAVEAGGAPEELLGANFASMSELAAIRSDEGVAPWLHQVLERIMDSIHRHRHQSHPSQLAAVLRYMSEHCCEDFSRDDVARLAYMSPSHFSRFFKKHLGQSFTAVLNQMRIDRSCEMLVQGDKDLKLIALETGFTDQSYFTKVFRKLRHVTPAEYRRQQVK